jgi:hypothetical protein
MCRGRVACGRLEGGGDVQGWCVRRPRRSGELRCAARGRVFVSSFFLQGRFAVCGAVLCCGCSCSTYFLFSLFTQQRGGGVWECGSSIGVCNRRCEPVMSPRGSASSSAPKYKKRTRETPSAAGKGAAPPPRRVCSGACLQKTRFAMDVATAFTVLKQSLKQSSVRAAEAERGASCETAAGGARLDPESADSPPPSPRDRSGGGVRPAPSSRAHEPRYVEYDHAEQSSGTW